MLNLGGQDHNHGKQTYALRGCEDLGSHAIACKVFPRGLSVTRGHHSLSYV